MKEYAEGEYLDAMTYYLQDYKSKKLHSKGRTKIAYVRAGSYSRNQLSLEVCEDATRVRNYDSNDDYVSSGITAAAELQLKLTGGVWKMSSAEYQKVKSCARN